MCVAAVLLSPMHVGHPSHDKQVVTVASQPLIPAGPHTNCMCRSEQSVTNLQSKLQSKPQSKWQNKQQNNGRSNGRAGQPHTNFHHSKMHGHLLRRNDWDEDRLHQNRDVTSSRLAWNATHSNVMAQATRRHVGHAPDAGLRPAQCTEQYSKQTHLLELMPPIHISLARSPRTAARSTTPPTRKVVTSYTPRNLK